jgi:hypothetical protein
MAPRSSTITAITRSKSAVLAAAREGVQGRVIAVVQPHRFTRLRDHMDDFAAAFNDADMVYAAPVYAAGEQPIEGVDSAAMVGGIKARPSQRASDRGADALAANWRCSSARRHGRVPWRGRHHQVGGRAGPGHCGAQGTVSWTPPPCCGRLTADAPLAPLVWFKSGGAALAVRAEGCGRFV